MKYLTDRDKSKLSKGKNNAIYLCIKFNKIGLLRKKSIPVEFGTNIVTKKKAGKSMLFDDYSTTNSPILLIFGLVGVQST